jgi:multidrug resistance efflux pump
MQKRKMNWFLIFWLISLICVSYLFYRWHFVKDLIGIVEIKSHLIGAQEPGTIKNMLVAVGEQVKKGQVLATLNLSDLETEINQLQNELKNIQKLQAANENRFSIEFQRLSLQLENEASGLADRLSLLESQTTELAGLNTEIERLKNAEAAGLGHSQDLTDLIIRRDVLASYLREQGKDLQHQNQKTSRTRETRNRLEKTDSNGIVKSMLLEPMERAEDLKRQIALTKHRLFLRTIISPCEGFIVEIFATPGDVVQSFAPIIAVEESVPRYLTFYVTEKFSRHLEVGTKIKIYSSRSRIFNSTGIVSFIHPGFTQASERLSFRGQLFWARKVRVDLEENHNLLPGELVYVRIENNSDNRKTPFQIAQATQAKADQSDTHGNNHPRVTKMQVHPKMLNQTRFEPSAVTWFAELERYLILSDDTGKKETKNDHAPMVFLMKENGEVEADPLVIHGTETVNDLEALSFANNNCLYFISSQSISKQGKRPKSREKILKVKWNGKYFVVEAEVSFLSLLLKSYSPTELKALGLGQGAKNGRPVLNIEGAAFRDNILYLGLKEPLSGRGALIWQLNNPDSIFNSKTLDSGQLSVYGCVQFEKHNGNNVGISDLVFDNLGRLWALSTIAGVANKNQVGGIHRIDRFADGHLQATNLYNFPGLKPEGICVTESNHFLIVFDADEELPSYCLVEVEEK